MTFREYRYLIFSDLFRLNRQFTLGSLLCEIWKGDSYAFSFWMRTARWTNRNAVLKWTLYPFVRFFYRHYQYKLGISISYDTEIGSGFYIGHFSCIVVHTDVRIGKNCNISQGVTLGLSCRGPSKGVPSIGDNVYIGPGAKVIGNVHIGDGAAIGANGVVTKDVPPNGVCVGVPGKCISDKGSEGYIINTDYDRYLTIPR